MIAGPRSLIIAFFLIALLLIGASIADSHPSPSWNGVLRDGAGNPVLGARVTLSAIAKKADYSAATSASGQFSFLDLPGGNYQLSVVANGKTWRGDKPLIIKDGIVLTVGLQLSPTEEARLAILTEGASKQASGGEHLSSTEVSSLPLNERDFSKLLLLAAGTMTDTNGAANFTQQFTTNGQRGATSVFAVDGGDTSDPELGGATFSNFNVDAIQEVQSSSGVMPAEIGHGAAGFTNVVTKSGAEQVHGSAFEFVRNAAFDARNYFDHSSGLDERRIPPFARNEFGVTNGGPLVIPKVYDGRGKRYYFAEYQGFRQLLGKTQVLPVPTEAERAGIDTTTFPGDTLTDPVNPEIASN